MPNDNINRAIKKGAGTDGSNAFETLNYEDMDQEELQ